MSETKVGIVGAGPAGLLLSHLLDRQGIDSVVLENRDRAYVEHRVRAGVLEQGTVDLLNEIGLGDRMTREGLVHHGIGIRFDRRDHRIPLTELTDGRSITIYGQQEVVKDLIAARLAHGGPIEFEVDDVRLDDLATDRPVIRYRTSAGEQALRCDFIAGCDGFHGASRPAIPAGAITIHEREYPFSWLGILAEARPASEELVYSAHERGFALLSMRSPTISRLYLQVPNGDDLVAWSDDRIWTELRARMEVDGDWELADGPVIDRLIAPMRGFVTEPMQYGRLYLAGDAAHIVPATGAKGLNLAVSDVNVLAEGIAAWYRDGRTDLLDGYTARCLKRVWRVQDFSWYMSSLLHVLPDEDGFGRRLRRAELDWLVSSQAASRSLAENYVGLPFA